MAPWTRAGTHHHCAACTQRVRKEGQPEVAGVSGELLRPIATHPQAPALYHVGPSPCPCEPTQMRPLRKCLHISSSIYRTSRPGSASGTFR